MLFGMLQLEVGSEESAATDRLLLRKFTFPSFKRILAASMSHKFELQISK